MAESKGTRRRARRNPITDIEPDQIEVRPDLDVGGVAVEIIGRDGRGFRTMLDWQVALDTALRMAGAALRLITPETT
jgi:hypothetical protein